MTSLVRELQPQAPIHDLQWQAKLDVLATPAEEQWRIAMTIVALVGRSRVETLQALLEAP
jgi:hypothetical protein